jgi:hypothetical protein
MRNRALIVGVSNYPAGISVLPAVTSDVREIVRLLGSAAGKFQGGDIRLLADADATRARVLEELRDVLGGADQDDTIFAYLAGHGVLDTAGNYFFVPHDTKLTDIQNSAVPLEEVKAIFDSSKSERLLLWLDFCRSGGILARNLELQSTDAKIADIVERTLRVTQGQGKVIMCACTADQSAYESPDHGHFTKYLLKGLQGAAANAAGEVTVNSLHDYIDREIGSVQQRPMFLGKMTGRIVLMHSRSISSGSAELQGPVAAELVIDDSGQWVLLADSMFRASSVRQGAEGEITVRIPSLGSEDDAKIRALKPPQSWGGQSIAYAHRNDGFLAQVKQIESESTSEGTSWIVTLKSEVTGYGGGIMQDMGLQENGRSYSGDDIAELRARRLLLNDPPPAKSRRGTWQAGHSMLESFVEGTSTKFPVKECVFRRFSAVLQIDAKRGMEKARLAAIYALKASNVFEHIIELRLGPLREGTLHVRCRGKRASRYSNEEPPVLEIEGDYALEKVEEPSR